MARNKYDQQKRHFKKKLSCRQVEPKQRDDKYRAARKDLATLQRECSAVWHSYAWQQRAGSSGRHLWHVLCLSLGWWHSDPRNGAGTGQRERGEEPVWLNS